jgi:hypothetical protein
MLGYNYKFLKFNYRNLIKSLTPFATEYVDNYELNFS